VISFIPRPLYPQGKSPWYPLVGGWVGLRAVLKAVVKRKIPNLAGNRTTAKIITLYYHLTTQLISWSKALLEKIIVTQLVKKFTSFYGTGKFITVFIGTCHWSLSSATCIQSTASHPITQRSLLILCSHLCLGLPSCLFPSGFLTKSLYALLISPLRATCPSRFILLDMITLIIFSAAYKL
jgi:hypothetical protein